MLSIPVNPYLSRQFITDGPVLLWRERPGGGRQGLLVILHACDLVTLSVDLSVYRLEGSVATIELDGERVRAVDRDGSIARAEPAFGATVELRDATLVADPDADPDLEFWVDEELDGELMVRVNAELDRALALVGPPLRRRPISVQRGVGRNEPCPCGSGRKYKRCCLGAAS